MGEWRATSIARRPQDSRDTRRAAAARRGRRRGARRSAGRPRTNGRKSCRDISSAFFQDFLMAVSIN